MKLLGWMHRKFRQSEPLRDLSIGNPCTCLTGQPSLDDLQYCQKPRYCTKPLSKAHQDNRRKSFTSLEAVKVEEDLGEDSSTTLDDLFHGFLAIGTLGGDSVTMDPSTPTFSISVENITEKNTEVTENELKLINDELEKVFAAEAKEDSCTVSSGRTSHVSTGRSSHCSTITLSGKPQEGGEKNGNGTNVCPLQGYLFGSSIELPETAAVSKKEHRTSLGELFQKAKLAEETPGVKFDKWEKRAEKENEKSAVHLMKKLLKKKMLSASTRNSAASGGATDSTSAEPKLHKILQMFHKKVHPENSKDGQKSNKAAKIDLKGNFDPCEATYERASLVYPGEDCTMFPQQNLSSGSKQHFKRQTVPSELMLYGGDSDGNRECWIRTDAEYLVLEL